MAASTQHVLEDVERRHAQLQQSVTKLQKALTHWTTWEAEYQALKEELQNADEPSPSPSQIREIARDLDGSLVTEKEVDELLGKDLQTKRSANQVVDMISRRIDYVQQNSATIEKQLDAAEKQLAGADILLEPGMENEEGLPMMDIEEELDDEGKEVSSSVNQTGKAAAELIEVLRKAGLQKAALDKQDKPETQQEPSEIPSTSAPSTDVVEGAKPAPASAESISDASDRESPVSAPPTKSVSFAEDVKPEASKKKTKSTLETDGYNEDLAATNFSSGTKVIELDQDDNLVATYPIIPQGESPEDAELRRQMLQYGLSEVGQVVAELDLDRPTVSYSDDDLDDDDDDDYNDYDTEDDEEDEYGRSVKPVVSDEYRKQMMELEKQLGARMLENVGPESDAHPLAEHIGDIRTMRVRNDDQFDQSLDTAKSDAPQAESEMGSKKKGVRFADDLNISEAPQPVQPSAEATQPPSKPVPTVSDTVVERSAPIPQPPSEPSKPAKVSRFKSARAASNQPPQMLPMPAGPETPPVPTGPAGRTLASTITEHVASSSEPYAPDEFDPIAVNREIQAEYNKARNKFIQQQGGFKPDEEDEERPIVEERDGKTKKVSRFMAARLKADGM